MKLNNPPVLQPPPSNKLIDAPRTIEIDEEDILLTEDLDERSPPPPPASSSPRFKP